VGSVLQGLLELSSTCSWLDRSVSGQIGRTSIWHLWKAPTPNGWSRSSHLLADPSCKRYAVRVSALLRLIVCIGSQVLYCTPRLGFFSPFPHGTCTLSVIEEYLGWEGGPPFSRQSDHHSNTPRLTGKDRTLRTNEQGYHLLWPDLPTFSESSLKPQHALNGLSCPTLPPSLADFWQRGGKRGGNTAYACCLLVFPSSNPQRIEWNEDWFENKAFFRSRSPLLTGSRLIFLPLATQMFQFAKFEKSKERRLATELGYGFPIGDPWITDTLSPHGLSPRKASFLLNARASIQCILFVSQTKWMSYYHPHNLQSQRRNAILTIYVRICNAEMTEPSIPMTNIARNTKICTAKWEEEA